MAASSPDMDTLVREVAAGRLHGADAIEAIVDRIAAAETPTDASDQLRREIHTQVAGVIAQDEELRGLTVARVPPPARPTSGAAAGSTLEEGKPGRPESGPGNGLDEDLLDEGFDEGFDEDLVAPPRRGPLYGALGVVAALGAGGAAWGLAREDACDRLVARICVEGETASCEAAAMDEALAHRGVDAARCASVMTDLDAAIEGTSDAERMHAFDRAVVTALGFDPRGDAAPTPPEPQPDGPPPPVVLVDGQPAITGLALDRDHVYWTHGEPPGVFRVRRLGGEVEAFGNQPNPVDVTATSDAVYWLSRGTAASTVWFDRARGPRDPASLVIEGSAPQRVAFLGDEFAYVDPSTGAIWVAAVSGGRPRELVAGRVSEPRPRRRRGRKRRAPPPLPPAPTELIGDANALYVASGAPVSTVRAVPLDGRAPPRDLATGQTAPVHLAVDDAHVYWLEAAAGAIVRVPKAGGAVEVLARDQTGAGPLAVDAGAVVWLDARAGVILSVPKTGGETTTLVSGLRDPRFLAVDDAALFWESGGALNRQARDPNLSAAVPTGVGESP